MTTDLGFTYFDCDNHYYEALDAFTRHIEPAFKKRAVQRGRKSTVSSA